MVDERGATGVGSQVTAWAVVTEGGVGSVFSPDDPLTIAAAGSKAKMQIWDVGSNAGAWKTFGRKLAEASRTLKE